MSSSGRRFYARLVREVLVGDGEITIRQSIPMTEWGVTPIQLARPLQCSAAVALIARPRSALTAADSTPRS